ncbi:MAG: hypothetical protein JJ934_19460 [Pseudomonadales bacterium]|nr:hypothetical protein [Pseudomonadales bacterium]MBO6659074.1 hypothetical protein [Pseudomonadales bacterium]
MRYLNPERHGPILINLFIALFWLFLIYDAYLQGSEMPIVLSEVELPELPLVLFAAVAFVGSLGASAFTFWQRKNIMEDMPVIAERVDRYFGEGAYSRFTRQLRPVWASILSSTILGVVGLYATYQFNHHIWSYAICGGTLLFAVFMFIAWLVSRRYPPMLS